MKSKNMISCVLIAELKSLLPGRRFLPLLLVIQRGLPRESVNYKKIVKVRKL